MSLDVLCHDCHEPIVPATDAVYRVTATVHYDHNAPLDGFTMGTVLCPECNKAREVLAHVRGTDVVDKRLDAIGAQDLLRPHKT